MNQVATLRVVSSREPELKIVPLERARAEWDALTGSHPEATLYHRAPWLEVLKRAFGVRPQIAIVGDSGSTKAACLLAQGGNPIRRSLISLPFSDFCPPLAVNDSAREHVIAQFLQTSGFALRDALNASQPHGGTYLGRALGEIDEKYDRLIVITDEQSHDSVPNPKARGYVINVASFQNGVGYGKWVHIDGWSDSVIEYIRAAEPGLE